MGGEIITKNPCKKDKIAAQVRNINALFILVILTLISVMVVFTVVTLNEFSVSYSYIKKILFLLIPMLAMFILHALVIKNLINRLNVYNSQLLEAAKEREYLIRTDQLTNLPNRRSFDERLPMEWERSARTKTPLSILIIDVDHFKKFNDTYGHLQGDIVLRAIGKTFLDDLKRPADFIARWGGEEFAAILTDTDMDGAIHIAEVMRQHIENTSIQLSDGTEAKITISIGINTHIPVPGESHGLFEDFIRHADNALYKAKNEGRNRVCYYAENANSNWF